MLFLGGITTQKKLRKKSKSKSIIGQKKTIFKIIFCVGLGYILLFWMQCTLVGFSRSPETPFYDVVGDLSLMCSIRGPTNWRGRSCSWQNFVATSLAVCPSFISMCSTHPSSISTEMANTVFGPPVLSFDQNNNDCEM